MTLQVAGFTGADTYFNGGTLSGGVIASGFTILSVTSTTITYALSHANATATSNGTAFQQGNSVTSCAPLASITSDSAGLQPITQPGLLTDGLGNVAFFALPATYFEQFYGASVTLKIKAVASAGIALNQPNRFTAAQIFTGNLTATAGQNTLNAYNINGEIWYDGNRYLTIQAAMNAANTAGSGIVRVGCGTFAGPTIFYSSVALVSVCPYLYAFPGSFGQVSPPAVGSVLQYSASLSLSAISNSKLDGFVLDFQNSGFGLVFGNSFTSNEWPNVAVLRCGSPTTDCIAWNVTSIGAASNAVMNHFGSLFINPNQTINNQANCMTLTGVGPVNAGGFVTDNRFDNIICSGGIRNGLISRINTDTNYFGHVFMNFIAPTVVSTGCLVLNDITPNTDQDADGGTIDWLVCQGSPTQFRLGATQGWFVKMVQGSAGFPTFTNLGTGTPLISVQTIGLPGVNSDLTVGGRIAASGIAGASYATGSIAGDITAARSAGTGVVFFGTDGTQIFRDGNGYAFNVNLPLRQTEGTCTVGAALNIDNLCASSTTHTFVSSYNNGAYLAVPQIIASGTAAMTTAAIAAGACGTTVTVVAVGVTTTDTITVAFNAAPAGTNAGLIAWATAGNVNFAYCPGVAETPAVATINWQVVR
jgi:hypothetical protein